MVGKRRVRNRSPDGWHVAIQAVAGRVDRTNRSLRSIRENWRATACRRGLGLARVAGQAARFIKTRGPIAGVAMGRVACQAAECLSALNVALAPGQGRRLETDDKRRIVVLDAAALGTVALRTESHDASFR